jgi:hypothetical protein
VTPTEPPPPSSRPAAAGVDRLGADFRRHRELTGDRNAAYARALDLLEQLLLGAGADRGALDRIERAWAARTFDAYYERPLLLLAALRFEALSDPNHPLARGFATRSPDLGSITREALADALGAHRLGIWVTLRGRKVQTNEVSRAIVWRWPVELLGLGSGARPLALIDVGASGGLNLIADRLQQTWVDGRGRAIAVARAPKIVSRQGYDTHPVNVLDDEDVAWAQACLWPGEPLRFEVLASAVRAFRELAATPARVELHCEPATVVPRRLSRISRTLPDRAVVFPYQSLLRDYLGSHKRAQYVGGMQEWLSRSAAGSAFWAELELVEDSGEMPAQIVVHAATGGGFESFALGRCTYHPSSVTVLPGAADLSRARVDR